MQEKNSDIGIGANIIKLRKKQGLTQAQLAAKLYVSNKTVSKWERGAGYPDFPQLINLSRILGTSIDALVMNEKHGIAVAGNMLTDTVKLIDVYPEKGMLANVLSISQAVGGCAPNTGIDLARIDPGLKVSVIGKIGNDDAGRYLLSEMRSNGLDVSGVVVSDKDSTSFSDVMSVKSTGERTFFHHRGANSGFSPDDINISLLSCKMLHIGYILLLDRFDEADSEYGTVMARFLSDVQRAGIRTSIDVVSSSDDLYAEKVAPALKYTDNAIMNEIEGSGISGIPVREADGTLNLQNVKKTLEMIKNCGVSERVIIHCPEAGFCLNANGELTVVPSLKLEKGYIKGTVGAGDAFCAGCLYGIYSGMTDKEILEFASGAACCNLSAEDSVSGMKDKEYIWKFISEHKRIKL